MNEQSLPTRAPAPRLIDHGLDLAIIGNGRTAALVDPTGRLVWWCYPRFNGDPVFSRLLAGDEEKGFCDVVLDGMVDFSSDYERNTPIVSTVLSNSQNAQLNQIYPVLLKSMLDLQ